MIVVDDSVYEFDARCAGTAIEVLLVLLECIGYMGATHVRTIAGTLSVTTLLAGVLYECVGD